MSYNGIMLKTLREPLYYLKKPYHLVKTGLLKALPAQLKHGFPARDLKIIAVTGTDGKTTSATLLYHLLKTAGKKVGLISTVAAYIGEKELETGLHVTSPDPLKLHRILKQMVDAQIEYVILEVTSHGAYQARTAGIKPVMAAITNLAHEHLDYHLDLKKYLQAKAIILNKSHQVFLNADDQHYRSLRAQLKHPPEQIKTYSQDCKLPTKVRTAMEQRFAEVYNRQNTILAYNLATELGLGEEKIAAGITSFPQIKGRMQEIETDQPFRVIIDFAHTPQAVEAALTTLRQQLKQQKKSGQLIAIYGAAGLRDQAKRPLMGQVGTEIADRVIFTAEDPRTEDVWSIIRQLKENLSENLNKVLSIADREEAIKFALTEVAEAGDIVVVLGKGHEQSMCYGKTEQPWSDVEVVQKILSQA